MNENVVTLIFNPSIQQEVEDARGYFAREPGYFSAARLQRARRRMNEVVKKSRASFKSIEGGKNFLDTVFRLDWWISSND